MINYLEISTNQNFEPTLYSIETVGDEVSLSAYDITLPAGTYYWRVKSAEGVELPAYTDSMRFEVKEFVPDYKVSITGGGQTLESSVNDGTSLSLMKYLKDNTQYMWQVTCDGAVSSETQAFTTVDLIDAPASATLNFDIHNNSVTITWDSVVGALGYKVLYKTTYASAYNGTGLTFDMEGTLPADSPVATDDATTSITLWNLLPGITYWFAVQTIGANGDSTPFEIPTNITASVGGGLVSLPAPSDLNLVVDQSTHDMNLTWTQEEE